MNFSTMCPYCEEVRTISWSSKFKSMSSSYILFQKEKKRNSCWYLWLHWNNFLSGFSETNVGEGGGQIVHWLSGNFDKSRTPVFLFGRKSAFKLLVFFSLETTVFHDGCHSEQRAKSVYIIKRKLILYHTMYTHDVLISIIQLNSFKIDGITSSPVVRFYTFLTLLF